MCAATLLSDLSEIHYKRLAYNTVEHLWSFVKVFAAKAVLFYGRKFNLHLRGTVKPYKVLNMKNAMVKSVKYVTEYTTCNLVMT